MNRTGKLPSSGFVKGRSGAVEYLVPKDLAAAIRMKGDGLTVLAGGTDVYPSHVERPLEPVVDITGLSELRGISETPEGFRIGALARWSDVASAALPSGFDGLRAAAREVGAVQVQNAGTIGGNLCNASPAADGVPPLLTLDASVELASASGRRALALEDFLTGYRQTALGPDELLTAVLVPQANALSRSAFTKLGLRRYLVISIVMAAATLSVDADGHIQRARVAVGACSPVARRLPDLEAALVGRLVREDLGALALPEHLSALTPIDDVRANADYRRSAALTLVRRTLAACSSER